VASGLLFAFFADGFVSALLLYGLTGLCSGGSYTPGLAIVAQRMPERQGLALGFYLAAASLGYAIGLLIASAMIPLAGWRGGFVVTALFPLLGMAWAGAPCATCPTWCTPCRTATARAAASARWCATSRRCCRSGAIPSMPGNCSASGPGCRPSLPPRRLPAAAAARRPSASAPR
jgi:MFS family permease